MNVELNMGKSKKIATYSKEARDLYEAFSDLCTARGFANNSFFNEEYD